jgi:hypothetical protein
MLVLNGRKNHGDILLLYNFKDKHIWNLKQTLKELDINSALNYYFCDSLLKEYTNNFSNEEIK